MGVPPVPQVKVLSSVPGRVSWDGLNSGRSEKTFPEVTAEKCSLIFESFQCDNTLGRMILACVCELLDFILAVRERATAEVQSQKHTTACNLSPRLGQSFHIHQGMWHARMSLNMQAFSQSEESAPTDHPGISHSYTYNTLTFHLSCSWRELPVYSFP